MEYRSLTLDDVGAWARLLAVSFDRTAEQMEQLLRWFHDGFELVTWGAWDGDRLVAQYNCRLLRLHVPGVAGTVMAGMGLDMAVDPDYRGRGLLDTVAAPVHEMIAGRGCVAGVGFSSAGGLAVTRSSTSYRYEVLGPMTSSLVVLARRHYPEALELADEWPQGDVHHLAVADGHVSYAVTPASIRHRFAEHPFRRYSFATWREGRTIRGLAVYRRVRLRGIPAAALFAAYGEDRRELLGRLAAALSAVGIRAVHVVASPGSPVLSEAGVMGPRVRLPLSRNPYHLIARALRSDTPRVLFEIDRWDCMGGDIL